MNRCRGVYVCSCTFVGVILALLAGIVTSVLYFFGVVTAVTIPLLTALIFGGVTLLLYVAAVLFGGGSEESRCLCRFRRIILTGAVGALLTSVLAFLLIPVPGNILAAIVVGFAILFLVLLISALICLSACADGCE